MRDAIARALSWALHVLLPARGRHAARPEPTHPDPVPTPLSPWDRPWTTPTPSHIIERHTPLRGEDLALVRPYVLPRPRPHPRLLQYERRMAALLATLGTDYPYTYDGAPFPRSAFASASGAAA